jgi:hypothetical protein
VAFLDIDAAPRIERAERDLIEAATASVARTDRGASVLPLAGGIAAYSDVASPLTKVAGVGFDGPPGDDDLAPVELELHARGVAVQVELSSLSEAGLAGRPTVRGYALVGFENVLALELLPGIDRPTHANVAIKTSAEDEIDAWMTVVVDGFAEPDAQGVALHESFPRTALERVIRAMYATPGMTRYLARHGGVAPGGVSLRLDTRGRIAHLRGAATLPEHRHRGVQGTHLDCWLADAERMGCEIAVITTATVSKSQENAQRAGFEQAYVRAILRLAPNEAPRASTPRS